VVAVILEVLCQCEGEIHLRKTAQQRSAHALVVPLIGLLCTAGTILASTFVVSPQGNDENPGTTDQSWRTLDKANRTLQPGDTVVVRAGVYHETITPVAAGLPGQPIVYVAAPEEEVVVDGLLDDLVVVYVSNYTVVDGFTIRNRAHLRVLKNNSYWVNLVGNHIVMRRCRVIADGDPYTNIFSLGATSRGIYSYGRYNTIERCFVRGQNIGVEVSGGTPRYTIVRFDTLLSNGQSNLVITSPYDGEKTDTTMERNLVEYCVMDTSWIEDNIQFESNYVDNAIMTNRGTIIRHCRLGHAAENAVDTKGVQFIILEDNLMYSSAGDDNGKLDGPDDSGGSGIQRGSDTYSRYMVVRNNIIWDNHTGATMYDGDRYYNNVFLNNRRSYRGSNGDYAGNDFAGVTMWNITGLQRAFVNNIVAMQPNLGVFNWNMDYGAKFYINNNLYYDPSGTVKFHHEMPNAVTSVGLSQWQNVLDTFGGYAYLGGKDGNSIEADPQFNNVPQYPVDYDTSWNFSVRPGSPAIDAGRPVARAIEAGTNSRTLRVDDAYFFCDGFGITDGDKIQIGYGSPVVIASLDYSSNTITLSDPRSWDTGAGVHLAFQGVAPDIGASEFVSGESVFPLPPQPAGPPDGASSQLSTVELRWSRAKGATTYYPQISTSTTFTPLVNAPGGISDTIFVLTGLEGNTTYYWRIRSGNSIGLSAWSSVLSFTTAPTGVVPGVPTTSGPTMGATGVTTNPLLSWNSVPGALTYAVQLSSVPGFATPLLDRSGIAGTSVLVDGLKNSTKYYWRVNATGSRGTSAWSQVTTLTTFALPTEFAANVVTNPTFDDGTSGWDFFTDGNATFALGSPGYHKATSAKISILQSGSTTELYQGNMVMSPDSTYRLSFAAYSSSGHSIEVSVQKLTSPQTSYGLLLRQIELTTEWKLFTLEFKPENFLSPVNDVMLRFDFSRYGVSGDVFSLDQIRLNPVNSSPPPEVPSSDYFLYENYPNPFNPLTTIRYFIPKDEHVVIKVWNLLGQAAATVVDGFEVGGSHKVTLDMKGFASGMYLCTLQAGDYKQTRKLLYVK
jgi:hypothetical protein